MAQRLIQDFVGRIRDSRFFRDRLSMVLLVVAIVLDALAIGWSVLKVHPTDVPVLIRYSNLLSGYDQLGPWYFPYVISLYATLVTLLNTAYAYYSYTRSRLVSFFLLASACVVSAFSFIISAAFGAMR